jgi:hypothetical protein
MMTTFRPRIRRIRELDSRDRAIGKWQVAR